MAKYLHIVFATDSRYLFPTQVAASSAVLKSRRQEHLIIDILDCGLEDAEWKGFECKMRVRFGNAFGLVRHKMNMNNYADLKSWHTSRGIYARLEIPQILTDVDWCIYADGDTLFCADPFELFTLRDERFALMGHIDDSSEVQKNWFEAHGYPWDANHYVCAGLLLMNLSWFRINGGTAKCFSLLENHPDIPFNDQDVLNIVCYGKVGVFPQNWGVFTYRATKRTLPGCFHYVAERPWEGPAGGYIPYPPVYGVWAWYAYHATGLRIWRIGGWSLSRYLVAEIQSVIFSVLFKFANVFPILRGRYQGILDSRCWSSQWKVFK